MLSRLGSDLSFKEMYQSRNGMHELLFHCNGIESWFRLLLDQRGENGSHRANTKQRLTSH